MHVLEFGHRYSYFVSIICAAPIRTLVFSKKFLPLVHALFFITVGVNFLCRLHLGIDKSTEKESHYNKLMKAIVIIACSLEYASYTLTLSLV